MEEEQTKTRREQTECERVCAEHLGDFSEREMNLLKQSGIFNEEGEVRLLRERHEAYVMKGLRYLSPGFICLDASRPWLCYWILHTLDLLKGVNLKKTDQQLLRNVIATIASCQNESGGFGGGPQQLSHCAPTYAGVLTLLIVGTQSAYDTINRSALYRWFTSRKHLSGGFCMHDDGEVDVRGTYTVISIASLLNVLTPELSQGVAEYLLSCQTYEGGFGGEPGHEAHGGYVFCAFAALVILGRARDADVDALEAWLCNRQTSFEGGFQGRTNKLVDGCYSFWQGATSVLIEMIKSGTEAQAIGWTGSISDAQPLSSSTSEEEAQEVHADDANEISYDVVSVLPSDPRLGTLSINQHALQRYILHCAQVVDGGLRDKPGKPRDFYHTCYCLSGLSCAQWGSSKPSSTSTSSSSTTAEGADHQNNHPIVYGDVANLVAITNPVYNIRQQKVERAMEHFWDKLGPISHQDLMMRES